MNKEKSITDLRAERKQQVDLAKGIVDAAKKENRKLTDDEDKSIIEMQLRCREIDLEIVERQQSEKNPHIVDTERKPFSLRKAIIEAANGNLSEDTKEINRRGMESMTPSGLTKEGQLQIPVQSRANQTATGTDGGSTTIENERMNILMPLVNNLVLGQLGATIMTGLTGNIVFPAYSGSTAAWAGENDEAADGAGTFSNTLTFSPKRITSMAVFSKQLLEQSSEDVEGIVRNTIINAISDKLEATAFGSAAKSDTIPAGLFNTHLGAGGAFTFGRLVDMETKLATQNALRGNLKYLMSPKLAGKGKQTLCDAGVPGYIIVNNETNGYPIIQSNNVAQGLQTAANEYGMILGNWSDFFVGQWGALDITVDPYTLSGKALIRLVINTWFDFGTLREESFVKDSATI